METKLRYAAVPVVEGRQHGPATLRRVPSLEFLFLPAGNRQLRDQRAEALGFASQVAKDRPGWYADKARKALMRASLTWSSRSAEGNPR